MTSTRSMTSLLRGEDLDIERERGLRTTGEDKGMSGTGCVGNLLMREAEVQWRIVASMSCGRRRFFETELSYGLVDSCNLGLSFDTSDKKCVGGCVSAPGDMKDPNRGGSWTDPVIILACDEAHNGMFETTHWESGLVSCFGRPVSTQVPWYGHKRLPLSIVHMGSVLQHGRSSQVISVPQSTVELRSGVAFVFAFSSSSLAEPCRTDTLHHSRAHRHQYTRGAVCVGLCCEVGMYHVEEDASGLH